MKVGDEVNIRGFIDKAVFTVVRVIEIPEVPLAETIIVATHDGHTEQRPISEVKKTEVGRKEDCIKTLSEMCIKGDELFNELFNTPVQGVNMTKLSDAINTLDEIVRVLRNGS